MEDLTRWSFIRFFIGGEINEGENWWWLLSPICCATIGLIPCFLSSFFGESKEKKAVLKWLILAPDISPWSFFSFSWSSFHFSIDRRSRTAKVLVWLATPNPVGMFSNLKSMISSIPFTLIFLFLNTVPLSCWLQYLLFAISFSFNPSRFRSNLCLKKVV